MNSRAFALTCVTLLTLVCSSRSSSSPDEGNGELDNQSGEIGNIISEETESPISYCKDCRCEKGEIIEAMRGLLAGESANKDGSCPKPEDGLIGMAYYSVDPKNLGVRITDRPFAYVPAYGPGTSVILNYNSDDTTALKRPRYTNLGGRWKLNFVQFVEVDATGADHYLNIGRGFQGNYSDDGSGEMKSTKNYGRDKLKKITAQHYEHRLPDGTVETYDFSGGVGWNGRERIFLTSIKDRYNDTVHLTWELVNDAPEIAGGARLTKVTDATGKEISFQYENASFPMRLTKITDPFGRQVAMQYHPDGFLKKLVDAVGVFSDFTYGSNGFITLMETSYGPTTFSRDNWLETFPGRSLHITDPVGLQHRLELHLSVDASEFGSEPLPPGITSEMRTGRYTFYWNPQANADGRTLANAYASQWLYDPTNSTPTRAVGSFKAPLTNRVWSTHGYSLTPGVAGATNEATSIVQVQPDGRVFTQSATRTLFGLPETRSDGFGRTVTYTYHPGVDSNLYQVKHTAMVSGVPVNTTLLTLEDYDNRRPGKITKGDGTITRLYYNSHGQLNRIVDANNVETRVAHNETVGHANRGRRTSVTEAFGTAKERTTEFEHDAYGRLWKVENFEGDVTTLEYDAIGGNPLASLDRLTKITYPDSSSERVEWELLHVKKHFDSQNRATIYERDDNGDVTAITTPDNKTVSYVRGNCCGGGIDTLVDAANNKTHWKHDILGRVTEKWLRWDTAEATRVQLSTYDTVGRPWKNTDARGNLRTFAYNDQGRLQYVYYTIAPGTTKATPNLNFNYEPVFGRPSFINDGTGSHTLTYVPFNPSDTVYGDGQLANFTTAGTNFASYTHTYTYDKLGRNESSTLAGVQRSAQWDELGRLLNTTTPLGVTTLGYQGLSNRVLTLDAAGALLTTFGYEDPLEHKHKLTSITHTKPGESIPYSSHNYGYDPLGRLNAWTKYSAYPGNPGLGNIEKKWDMFYDSSDQLESVGETTRINSGSAAITDLHSYAYDDAGNRTSEQRAGGVRSWQANGFNQLTTQQVGGELEVRGTSNVESKVTVDGQPAHTWLDGAQWRWRKTVNAASGSNSFAVQATEANVPPGFVPQVTNKTLQFDVTPEAAISYSYDADGNMLSDGITSYEWDAENRLVAATSSTSGRVEFAYDAFSRRVRITEPVTGSSSQRVLHLIWDGMNIVQQRHFIASVLQETRDYFGHGERRNFPSASVQTLLYTTDHLGSIREAIDKVSGTVLIRYDYSPYGIRSRVGSGGVAIDFGFTGHYINEQSGLVLAPFRAFNPALGNWLSRDPIGEAGGVNLYNYARKSPFMFTDPLGLSDMYHHPGARNDLPNIHHNGPDGKLEYNIAPTHGGGFEPRCRTGHDDAWDRDRATAHLQRWLQDPENRRKLHESMQKLLNMRPNDNDLVSRLNKAIRALAALQLLGACISAKAATDELMRAYESVLSGSELSPHEKSLLIEALTLSGPGGPAAAMTLQHMWGDIPW